MAPEIFYGIGALALLLVLGFAVMRAGRLRGRERERVEQNAAAMQRREDPMKR